MHAFQGYSKHWWKPRNLYSSLVDYVPDSQRESLWQRSCPCMPYSGIKGCSSGTPIYAWRYSDMFVLAFHSRLFFMYSVTFGTRTIINRQMDKAMSHGGSINGFLSFTFSFPSDCGLCSFGRCCERQFLRESGEIIPG